MVFFKVLLQSSVHIPTIYHNVLEKTFVASWYFSMYFKIILILIAFFEVLPVVVYVFSENSFFSRITDF